MFTPEFRNRLDSIISFNFLSQDIMKSIVEKAVNYLEGQLSEKNISIQLSNEAKKYLSTKGYDKKYGARPLQRLIQKEVKEPLAEEILFGKLKKGGLVKIIKLIFYLKISLIRRVYFLYSFYFINYSIFLIFIMVFE